MFSNIQEDEFQLCNILNSNTDFQEFPCETVTLNIFYPLMSLEYEIVTK